MNKFSSSVTYEKPRRLEEDTIQYLLQFDEQFTEQLQQVSSYNITSSLSSLSADDPPSDSPLDIIAIMINNVLDEIKYRLASTICEKSTNYLLERICSYANISQLVDIMNKCQTYIIFLSQNRYGSHVIQV